MANNILFILCHQDDEMGLFNRIKSSIEQKKNVLIIYMTSGYDISIPKKKITRRDIESICVLKKLGVEERNIFFIGRKNNTKIYELYLHLNKSYKDLVSIVRKLKGNTIIFTHTWEGGNEDHDACHSIVLKLYSQIKKIKKCYQFSLYHGKNTFFNFFKVQDLFKENGKIIKDKISIFDKVIFMKYLFHYKSQYKVWIGLYPLLIINILFNKYGFLQIIKKNMKLKKPHKNKLLYERMRNNKYSNIINQINLFLLK